MIKVSVFSEEKAWSKRLKNTEIFFKKICRAFPKKYQFSNKKVLFSLLLSNNKNIKNTKPLVGSINPPKMPKKKQEGIISWIKSITGIETQKEEVKKKPKTKRRLRVNNKKTNNNAKKGFKKTVRKIQKLKINQINLIKIHYLKTIIRNLNQSLSQNLNQKLNLIKKY